MTFRIKGLASELTVNTAQARVLSEVFEEILGLRRVNVIHTVDSSIIKSYLHPEIRWAWFKPVLRTWSDDLVTLMLAEKKSLVVRYVILPYPKVVKSHFERKLLIETILLHVHSHLWHGAICGVIFIDPTKQTPEQIDEMLHLFILEGSNITIKTPNFYESQHKLLIRESGSVSRLRRNVAKKRLTKCGTRPCWIYYDEDNFDGGRKLNGWRWENIRRFYGRLYLGVQMHCYICQSRLTGSFALDHIAPYSKGHPQTLINFQPTCKRCNSEKSSRDFVNPYVVPLLQLANEYEAYVRQIVEKKPAWLGRISRPNRSELDLFD